jgi:hypothetical protein
VIVNTLSSSSNTTTTITFRISKRYEEFLRKKSEQERVSINTIANQIFGEYIEWQQFIEKFGTIVLSKEAFSMLIESIDEDKLIDLGIKIGSNIPQEFILFKWKEITKENVIEFLQMFINHCINGENDCTFTMDNKAAISIKHNMGLKWSIFLKSFFGAIIKETLQKEYNTKITKNSLIVHF